MIERTLVLIKPDGIKRGLVGKITSAFEDCGLKIVGMKLVSPSPEKVQEHYNADENWLRSVGEKSIKSAKERNEAINEDPIEIGKRIRSYLINYLANNPVIAMVLEGNNAIEIVRKIIGSTQPSKADPSTIRGKYSSDSYDLADSNKRAVRNLVHASEDKASAEREIKVWFNESELIQYSRSDEKEMYG
ncbi:MAG: nucleoside-diphosphate kinase [Candidatus Rehaiarchaeum fermentans]|nr:nucleoside-diphosphate kinase [Candidatus Rehaiarchaeum fermentans]MCW1293343.1 nucleoside-diphosphate kinase [Candidatus Rehaiarchaeum fermentans]MCW1297346.1 nucleoside-diphosphate kinase [Candidatus Rehaiarchaeum fermentans]MCW1302153.1 nucleoside-diphosphate kinase [Candidatus Rehaiarchaeum fermentans]